MRDESIRVPVVVAVGKVRQTDVVMLNIVTLPVRGAEPSYGLVGNVDQRGGDRQLGEGACQEVTQWAQHRDDF